MLLLLYLYLVNDYGVLRCMLFMGALYAIAEADRVIGVGCRFLGGSCNELCRVLVAFLILFCSSGLCG